jgi:Trypsin-like peptidase domain
VAYCEPVTAEVEFLRAVMVAAYLQSYVVSVCLVECRGSEVSLKKHIGTAFFFSKAGYFMTAGHVVSDAFSEAASSSLRVGLIVKADNGSSAEPVVFLLDLSDVERAPSPYDITVGHVSYYPDTPLRISSTSLSMWQEVATMGYPASSTVPEVDGLWVNLRGHKGYIQRQTLPRDIHAGDHPNGIELSFLLSPGMSGCPIFTTADEIVVGVGVSSIQSEMLDSQVLEVIDDTKTYRERTIKLEQFGFAHDIAGLLQWRAEIFDGQTLEEVANLPLIDIKIDTIDVGGEQA